MVEDITERKRAEEALNDSKKRYRKLLEVSPDAIAIVQGFPPSHLYVNSAYTKLFGYTLNDVEKGFSPFKIIQEADKAEIEKKMYDRNAGKEVAPRYDQVDLAAKNGRMFPCEIIATLINYNGQTADMLVFRDITEKKKAEEHIHTLTHKLFKSQENERQRISRELHDSVAQDLSASKINCEVLLNNDLAAVPKVKENILQISETLRRSIMSVRDLSYDLRPAGLDELGLVQSLQEYCEDFSEKTRIIVDFKSAAMNKLTLNADTKINLYRLVQEGINNVKKHADAQNVSIKLVSALPNIILRIGDDGKGFDVMERLAASSDEKRMGLQTMKERVALLQGKMDIQSSPKKGTKIVIAIPYIEPLTPIRIKDI